MIGLLNNRQYTSKTFDNEDGTRTLQAHGGHIHYKGTDNSWQDVYFALEDMGEYWQMVKASYKLLIAKDFGAEKLIKFQNKYRGANHEIVYEPKMLAWVNNPDLSDMQVFRNQQSVQGRIVDGNVIRYDNAFGDGLHFEITILRSGFKKEIVIEAKNKLELPPTANHKLVALFEYTGTGLKVKSNDKLREWTSGDYFEESDGFRIAEEANDVYQSFIRPAYIFDDGGELESIKVFWKLHNGKLYQAKVLPTQFLLDATYPVRADTTTNYDGDTGDGAIYYLNATSWSQARDATDGTGNDGGTGASRGQGQGCYEDGNYDIFRCFFPFDLSGAPSGQTVTAVSWFGYYISNAQSNVSIQESSFSSITNSEYDSFSGSEFGHVSWAVGANEISFNASGISYVDGIFSSGTAKFCTREYDYDYLDSVPGSGESYKNGIILADNLTSIPYLEVTYSEAPAPSTFISQIIMS